MSNSREREIRGRRGRGMQLTCDGCLARSIESGKEGTLARHSSLCLVVVESLDVTYCLLVVGPHLKMR